MKNLATILSHLMTENRISSAELARKTGIGQPVIYRIMTGTTDNPQVLSLKPIAAFFGISIDQLLGYSPLNSPKSLDNHALHNLHNKLTTIKTIASVLVELLPQLITSHQSAINANIIKDELPSDILPLLPLNTINLLKIINQIQDILLSTYSNQD